jgi:hypothetical protein
MPKPGETINIPAKVLHILTADGKTTLVLQRIPQAEPKGSTAEGEDAYAVMWGT